MAKLHLWLLLSLLGTANILRSQAITNSALPQLTFTDTKLDNGLRVIIAPDHSAPVCAVSVTYNVGSRNEQPGRTGFAHLFEHMMFEGSENVGKGEHFILVQNNGGDFNGTTNEDRTNYFEALPKNQLDLGLFLEADRMRSLVVNEANLDNQRNAVQEERRLGIDNEAYGKSELEIDNLAYDNFGYKHSTLGEMRDLDAATVQDVKDFFRIYYAPDNAVLVIVGDVDSNEAMEKVKKYFGLIPHQPAPAPVDFSEPQHYGERREVIVDPLARLPRLLVAFRIPQGNTPDNYALHVLADILASGQDSRLYRHLVKDKELASEILVQADARRGPSLLYVQATPRPGVKINDLETAIYDEIAQLRKRGVTESEIQNVRRQALRVQINRHQSDLEVANRIGQYAVYFDDPNLINTIYDKYSSITAEQVMQVAGKYMVQTGRTVVTTLPGIKTAASTGSEN
jgi:predicted Zn-dependent peptidase